MALTLASLPQKHERSARDSRLARVPMIQARSNVAGKPVPFPLEMNIHRTKRHRGNILHGSAAPQWTVVTFAQIKTEYHSFMTPIQRRPYTPGSYKRRAPLHGKLF